MSIYLPPSARHFDSRWTKLSAWLDHQPFGYDIIEATKPALLVELGTNKGVSYFTFCQSIKDHDVASLCYAVDTWLGDDHVKATESYKKSTFQMVNQHNQTHFGGFSYLLRMRFDEALNTFDDESIDLLHIDGYHTYEAVSEDFNTWIPKVKPGGMILLHDITARIKKDFGVWKFWREISPQYESFAFNHGFGLGIVRKPGKIPTDALLTRLMFQSDEGQQEALRKFYVHLSNHFALKRHTQSNVAGKIDRLGLRIKSLIQR